jgi:hypothetical protein
MSKKEDVPARFDSANANLYLNAGIYIVVRHNLSIFEAEYAFGVTFHDHFSLAFFGESGERSAGGRLQVIANAWLAKRAQTGNARGHLGTLIAL